MQATPSKNSQPNHPSGGPNSKPRSHHHHRNRQQQQPPNGNRRPAPLVTAYSFDSFSLPMQIPASTTRHPCHSAPVLPSESPLHQKMMPQRKTHPKSVKGTPTQRFSPPAFKTNRSSPNFSGLPRVSPLASNDLFAMPKYCDSPKANKVPPPPSSWLEEYERKNGSPTVESDNSSSATPSETSSDSETASVTNELKSLTIGGIDFGKLLTGDMTGSFSEPASPITVSPTTQASSYRTGIRVNPLQLIAACSAS